MVARSECSKVESEFASALLGLQFFAFGIGHSKHKVSSGRCDLNDSYKKINSLLINYLRLTQLNFQESITKQKVREFVKTQFSQRRLLQESPRVTRLISF